MGGYAIKTTEPFITSKPLKRTPPTQENIDMVKLMDSHEFFYSIKDRFVKSVPLEKALEDVTPIPWSDDVLDGNKKVHIIQRHTE